MPQRQALCCTGLYLPLEESEEGSAGIEAAEVPISLQDGEVSTAGAQYL